MREPTPLRAAPGDLSALKAKLLLARDSLVRENPFLGALVLRLPVVITEDSTLHTAAVSVRGVCFIDRTYLDRVPLEAVRATLLHETLHVALDYWGRQGERTHQRWNIAHDFAINALIGQSGLPQGFLAWPPWLGILRDSRFDGMSAEAIYEQLPANLAELGMGASDCRQDEWERLPEEEREAIRRTWQQHLVEAAERAMEDGTGQGMPPWALKLIGPILEPQVPWSTVLAQRLHGHVAGRRRTFARPGRRSQAVGQPLPGSRRNLGAVGVFLDASGSTGPEEMAAFLGELLGLLRQLEVPVRLIHWDTVVTKDAWIDDPDGLEQALQAKDFPVEGGGGTDPRCVIRRLEGDAGGDLPLPAFGLLFTDGWVPWPAARDWPLDLLVVTTHQAPECALGYETISLQPR